MRKFSSTLTLFWLVIVSLSVSVLWIDRASAVQIPGVFSTGVDGSGNLLPVGTLDSHYSLTVNPAGGTGAKAATPNPAWVGNTSTSQWVNPSGNGNDNLAAGTYDYVRTFNLTGLIPSTAVITGTWAADNSADIFLNGLNTGITKGSFGFQSLDAFTINSGFLPGVNTLDFRVVNEGTGPTGLQVNITRADATATAVPEPTSILLLCSGLAGLAAWRRVRRSLTC